MKDIQEIALQGYLSQSPEIVFLRAEVPEKYPPSAVRIRYALHGKEQQDGLRLDLNKWSFLDRVPKRENQDMDKILEEAAPKIAQYLASILYPKRNRTHFASLFEKPGI